MDGYYHAQASMPYYSGAARQRGRGLGAVARTVGRIAMPLLKNVFLPAAKRVARDFLIESSGELPGMLSGKVKPKNAFKSAATKTFRRQIGSGKRVSKKVPKRKKSSKGIKKTKSLRKLKPKKKVRSRSRIDILGKLK